MSKYAGNIITTGADAGYSVYFDGTGDYLQSTTAALSGAFTIEFWYYRVGTGSNYCFTVGDSITSTGIEVYIGTSGTVFNAIYSNGAAQVTSTTQVPTANGWSHIALVREGANVIKCYLNGVQVTGSYTSSATFNSVVRIGAEYYNGNITGSANAYISNFRIVNGTALYTAAFTPPTQLLAITNTSLLTCNSPAIIDQSSNAFAITANGDAKVSPFTPFAGYQVYKPELGSATPGVWTLSEALQAKQTRQWNMYDPYFRDTVLALRSGTVDGAQNNSFVDSSSTGYSVVRNPTTGPNAPTQGTFTPFSPTGWSVYTNSDRQSWVSVSSASLALGTGDFEISFYMYYINGTYIMGTGNTSGSWAFTSDGSFRRNTLASDFISGGVTARTWAKIRCVRISSVTYLYVNDVLRGSAADTQNYTNSNLGIGNFTQAAGGSPNFASEVYISNLKIVKAGTTILDTFRNNRYIDNSPTPLTVTPNANATYLPPFVVPYTLTNPDAAYSPAVHGGSGYFDGTDDYLSITTAATNYYSALGEWTWEAWIYPLSFSGPQYSCAILASSLDSMLLRADVTTAISTTLNMYAINSSNGAILGASGTSAGTLRLNEWAHVVVQRRAGEFDLFINGSRVANVNTQTATAIRTTDTDLWIGKGNAGTSPFWNGYISDVRIQNGSAKYSGTTYTVPTAPLSPTGAAVKLSFTNAAIFDTTGKNVLETVGNAQSSVAQKKYGPTAMYFDGTGDYLLPRTNSIGAFGSGDFTIEFWINFVTVSSAQIILDFRTATSTVAPAISLKNTGVIYYYTGGGSPGERITGSTLSAGTWYHVAVCRSSGSTRMFVNGVQVGSTYTDTNVYVGAANRPWVGGLADGTTPAQWLNAYVSDLRITRFARYKANFTPLTSRIQDQ
jgi:hypothetical protein